jgi:predicted protein tyrosine phosphatase
MTKNYSDVIRQCRRGVVSNPYQGKDKKVLFVCSMGILRSATGARIYANKYNTRCCGSWGDALIPLTPLLIAWADEIVFVNKANYKNAVDEFGQEVFQEVATKVLNIPDCHPHMDIELVKAFDQQYEKVEGLDEQLGITGSFTEA